MYLLFFQFFSMFETGSFKSCGNCHFKYFNNIGFGLGPSGSLGSVRYWNCVFTATLHCIRPIQPCLALGHSKSLRCACWQERRLGQLTSDSMQNGTSWASFLNEISVLFMWLKWLLLPGGGRFQTVSVERGFSLPRPGPITCVVPVIGKPPRSSETHPLFWHTKWEKR